MSLRDQAQHEAGHYLILYILEIEHTPRFLALGRSGWSGGCCCFTSDVLPLEHAAIQALGGLAANVEGVRRAFPDEEDPRHKSALRQAASGAYDDVDQLKKRFQQDDGFFFPYFEKAIEIVRANWELIETLGAQLEKHGVLYHEEPKMILESIRKRDIFTTSLLEVYRLLRREDPTCEALADFKGRYPHLPWFESLQSFAKRKAWIGNDEATKIIAEAQRAMRREASFASM